MNKKYTEFKGSTLNYIGLILAIILTGGVGLFFLFNTEDFRYDEIIYFRIMGILAIITSIYFIKRFNQEKNFFIRISDNGISSHSFDEITWDNIKDIKFKTKNARAMGEIEVMVIHYSEEGKTKKFELNEKQVIGYNNLKKLLFEKRKINE